MSEAEGIIIGALVGAICGLAAARVTAKREADALFLTALAFLGGGTQKRNLGLSAIELYWKEYPQHKRLCTSLLVGSAIYLLLRSNQKDAAHEVYNLHRIMDYILDDRSYDGKLRKRYESLLEALSSRKYKVQTEDHGGLCLAKETMDGWHEKLTQRMNAGSP
jgi:hypothetical protein